MATGHQKRIYRDNSVYGIRASDQKLGSSIDEFQVVLFSPTTGKTLHLTMIVSELDLVKKYRDNHSSKFNVHCGSHCSYHGTENPHKKCHTNTTRSTKNDAWCCEDSSSYNELSRDKRDKTDPVPMTRLNTRNMALNSPRNNLRTLAYYPDASN